MSEATISLSHAPNEFSTPTSASTKRPRSSNKTFKESPHNSSELLNGST